MLCETWYQSDFFIEISIDFSITVPWSLHISLCVLEVPSCHCSFPEVLASTPNFTQCPGPWGAVPVGLVIHGEGGQRGPTWEGQVLMRNLPEVLLGAVPKKPTAPSQPGRGVPRP